MKSDTAPYVGYYEIKDEHGETSHEARYHDGGGRLTVRLCPNGEWQAEHRIRGMVHFGEPEWKLILSMSADTAAQLAADLQSTCSRRLPGMVELLDEHLAAAAPQPA